MKFDTIETFGKSQVQHGKLNNRVYLMKLHRDDMPGIIKMMQHLIKENAYTKIFAKIPRSLESQFNAFSFKSEALVPNFFNGTEDCLFMAQFFDGRDKQQNQIQIDSIIKIAREKAKTSPPSRLASHYDIRKATPDDTDQICGIFLNVFDSYPFPIFNPDYIQQTMNRYIDYYVASEDDKIISVSSAEIDMEHKNAEMTDFATLPEFRSQGIAQALLQKMEYDMKKKGLCIVYTIARALSPGMNVTFAKNDYHFAGTLVNNTNIAGKIESMNIWYKNLTEKS